MIKRELRYIRYRICRNIYYADQCPMDNRKNRNNMKQNILAGLALALGGFAFMLIAILMA